MIKLYTFYSSITANIFGPSVPLHRKGKKEEVFAAAADAASTVCCTTPSFQFDSQRFSFLYNKLKV